MTESPAMQAARRSRPWEIATDLEKAAIAFRAAAKALEAIDTNALDDVEAANIHVKYCDALVTAAAAQALSDKYQAIADAEVEV